MALAEAKQTATEARLAGMTMPDGGCLQAARQAALSRVQTMGLPTRRDEYWKYTRPDSLTAAEPAKAAVFETGEAPMFDEFDRLKIVFVDGIYDPEASDDLSLEGVQIDLIADN